MDMTDVVRPTLVQAGWAIYSQDGAFMGEVLGADRDRFLLRAAIGSELRLEIPTKLIIEEEPNEMRARVGLDEGEISAEHEAIAPIPRSGA